MNFDSYAGKLAEAAIQLAKIESVGAAKEFLIVEMRRRNFKFWEQCATVNMFNYLLKGYRKVRHG